MAGSAGASSTLSTAGIVLAAVSLVVMPVLSRAQRRTGRELGLGQRGGGLEADAAVHVPSAVLLAGLVLNSLFGWWWADPLAALAIGAVALKEGREAWRGEACCDAC